MGDFTLNVTIITSQTNFLVLIREVAGPHVEYSWCSTRPQGQEVDFFFLVWPH